MNLGNSENNFEVGNIVDGKITGIVKFGAFVEIAPQKTGLVHISEISRDFVKNISDYFEEGQMVKVKILSIGENGKTELSIKQAADVTFEKSGGRASKRLNCQNPNNQKQQYPLRSPAANNNFEDMMAKFKRISADKLSDITRQTEVRRSRNGNRGN